MWTVVSITVLHVVWYRFGIGGPKGVEAFGDFVTIPVTGAAAWLCLRAGRASGGRERRGWFYVAAACASWLCA